MIVTVKDKSQQIVIPPKLRKLARIKPGDRLDFQVTGRTITITASEPEYQPTSGELEAMQRGEAEIAAGEYVSLGGLLNALGNTNRKKRTPKNPKLSR